MKFTLLKKSILISLLAFFLFGGVGFGVQKVGAEAVSIQESNAKCGTLSGSARTTCVNKLYYELNRSSANADGLVPMPGTGAMTGSEIFIGPDGTRIERDVVSNDVTTISPDGTRETTNEDSTKKGWMQNLLSKAGSLITGTLGKTVMMINGIILQIIAIPILSFFLRIAAAMLDMAVNFTLSTTIYRTTTSGVVIVWALMRDICNITFIFVLLWSAIQMIVGIAGANAKKMIANVVIAALLINFSLFITRIVIDIGNIMGVAIYNKILVTGRGSGIDTILMDSLGLSGIFGSTGTNSVFSIAFGVVSWLQVITILTTFIVFMYAMLLMGARVVVLIFLAALSPIGFMGDVLPKFSEYSKQWRETLYGQVMIAPVFLLFVYLIVNVATEFDKAAAAVKGAVNTTVATTTAITGMAANTVAQSTSESKDYLMFFKFVMIILLLVVAVKITKKMTGAIGAAVEKFGMAAVGLAIGAATGGAALLARQTLGRASANALEGEKGADLRARAAAGDKKARMQLAYHEKASKSSFDARNTKAAGLAGKAFGDIGSRLGVAVPGAGKAGAWAGNVGLDGTVAEARKAQQEAENKKFNELNASVTNKQKLEANTAIQARDTVVKAQLATNADHVAAKLEKEKLLKVDDTHKDLVNEQEGFNNATAEMTRAMATGDGKQIAEAKKSLNEAKRIKDSKVKAIQEELKKKYAGELAELDDQMKRIKTETEKAVESTMSAPDRAKMNVVNQARNYADSVRNGRAGTLSYIQGEARRTQLADRMENQRQT